MDEATTPKRPKRANGDGSVYHVEGEDRWRASITWRDANGGLRRRQFSGKREKDVRKRLKDAQREIEDRGEPSSTMLVTEFLGGDRELDAKGHETKPLRGWLKVEQQRVRPSTWRQREQYVRSYIAPAIGRIPLARLQPADVEKMTADLVASGRSPRTAATARVILRRALSDAVRDGLVHRNVAALARPPRIPHQEIAYLDPAQLRTLLVSARKDSRLGPLIALAATTGLRQGELLALRWDDVADGQLTVRRSMARDWSTRDAEGRKVEHWTPAEPKTGRSRRTISLPSVATEVLDEQRARQGRLKASAGATWKDREGLVFTDDVGAPLRGDQVTKGFHRILERAGLPSVPFHALRHSAATALLGAGVPLRVVSDLLGHSTIVITANVYAAVIPELRREAAEAMDRVLG